MPPPVEAEVGWSWKRARQILMKMIGVCFRKLNVYIFEMICIFNQSLSLSLSLSFSLSLSLVPSSVSRVVTFAATITLKECMQNISFVHFVPITFVILCSAFAIDALTR